MENNTQKESLFISYCWSDGNIYADELEAQLSDYFNVQRDKSQLIANDNIIDFMAEIANCDNVVIVLTADYVKSLNCMREISFLLQQPDWIDKVMVLIIDESIYATERKIEILNYWNLRLKYTSGQKEMGKIGRKIIEEDLYCIEEIVNQLENFLAGISRRKNPSQIAIVNELVRRKKNRNTASMQMKIQKGEKFIMDYIKKNKNSTLRDIAQATSMSQAYTCRMIHRMTEEGKIIVEGEKGNRKYIVQK